LRHLGCDTQTPLTLQLSPWLQHLGPNHYPFVYLFANWLAGRPAPPVALRQPWFPCRPVDWHSFPNTCFTVTSTGFFGERYLAIVRRLAWVDHFAMAQSCRRILLWVDCSTCPSGARPPKTIQLSKNLYCFTYLSLALLQIFVKSCKQMPQADCTSVRAIHYQLDGCR
jgi:hypothetical protein